jgi:hypothetical protein
MNDDGSPPLGRQKVMRFLGLSAHGPLNSTVRRSVGVDKAIGKRIRLVQFT